MPVERSNVAGVEELVSRVLEIAQSLPEGHYLWFRGLPCADYTLKPKLLRTAVDSSSALDREERLITRFRQRSLPFWPGGYPQDDWEHLFMMQHNGVPTRLLDWSENVFVGLFFAVGARDQHSREAGKDHVCRPTLWCVDPAGWNRSVPQLKDFGDQVSVLTTASRLLDPYQPQTTNTPRLLMRHDTPVAIYGTHNSARIVAQRGTFTVAGKGLLGMEQYAPEQGDTTLWKLVLDLAWPNLRLALSHLGFTESMIFPDLPALARELMETEL